MTAINSFKKLIYQFDMFCSSQLLRYHSQTQFKTLTGGIVSLAIICVVAAGFASMVADTLNRVSITSSLVRKKNSNPPEASLLTNKQGMFMLGLSIQSFDFSFSADLINGPQYFTLMMNSFQYTNGISTNTTRLVLEQCTHQHWSMMPEFEAQFDSFGVGSWLCLPIATRLPLSGTFTSPINQFFGFELSSCKNQTSNGNCAPQQQIDELLAHYQNFYITWNYINPVINPNEQEYITYYVEGGDYLIFSSAIGSEAWVYFSDFTIKTDNSILPYQSISTKTGCIVEQKSIIHPYTVTQDGSFTRVYFSKSENSLIIERQVQKISAVLSYIGGLIGAITAVLFLIKSYTDTSLEVAIGLSLFQINQQQKKNDNKSQKNKDKSFNLFGFVRLISYRLLKFCGWKGQVQSVQHLNKCQEEAIKQMDVEFLLKRVIKLETCISKLLTPQQLKEIREGQPITFKTAKNMRNLLLKERQLTQSDDENPSKKDNRENRIDIKEVIENYPSQIGEKEEDLYNGSGISIYKVNQDKLGVPFGPVQIGSQIAPQSGKDSLEIFKRATILRNGKLGEHRKVSLNKDQNQFYPSKPVARISPSIII